MIGIFLSCFSSVTMASTVVSCATALSNNSNRDYDRGDAPMATGQYGQACHDTNAWQQLGGAGKTNGVKNPLTGDGNSSGSNNSGWDVDTLAESQVVGSDDVTDNGVKWSTDGGTTWTNSGVITQGDTVVFKFKVKRSNTGNHQFDELKAWIDWDRDFSWEENLSEVLIDEKWAKNADKYGNINGNGSTNTDLPTNNNTDTFRKYTQTITIPVDALTGDIWMRARVTCENSLISDNNNTLYATGYYHQGEVEDYKLTIAAKPSDPISVPEPTTLLIFASALLGLRLNRKRAFNV